MTEIGKKYHYTINACKTRKTGVLIGISKAWYKFDNGDWIPSSDVLYESREDLETILTISEGIENVKPWGEGWLKPFRNNQEEK